MSIKVMTQVWEADLPSEQKYVLLKMADHADHDGGNVYPSVARLAWFTGLSERSVQRRLSELRAMGVLEVANKAHRHKATEYRIRGDRLTPLGDFRGDSGVVLGVTVVSPKSSVETSVLEEDDQNPDSSSSKRAREAMA